MSATTANLGQHVIAAERSQPAYQGYQILHLAFTVSPIFAGLDKFFHLLCNWDQYLAPWIAHASPIGGHNLMLTFGIVEVVAGLLVAVKPKIGAPIVGAWLLGIVINLLTMGTYFDRITRFRALARRLGALAFVARVLGLICG